MSGAQVDDLLALRDVAKARAPLRIGLSAAWVLVLLVAARVVWAVATNKNFEWPVVGEGLAEASILHGLAGLSIWFFRGTPLLVQLIF